MPTKLEKAHEKAEADKAVKEAVEKSYRAISKRTKSGSRGCNGS